MARSCCCITILLHYLLLQVVLHAQERTHRLIQINAIQRCMSNQVIESSNASSLPRFAA